MGDIEDVQIDFDLFNLEPINNISSKGCPLQVISILEATKLRIKEIEEEAIFKRRVGKEEELKKILMQKVDLIQILPSDLSNTLRLMRDSGRIKVTKIVAKLAENAEQLSMIGTISDLDSFLSSDLWHGDEQKLEKLIKCLSD